MKNLKLGMALLAALVLVFAAGCSDGGGGNVDAGYEVIGGTYYVYTAKGLQAWADYIALGNYSTNCTLTADIDMQDATWTPVESYSGTFDGDGHKVSNFAINLSASMVGFFGTLNGTVTGLGLENATVTPTGAEYVGSIAGHNVSGNIIACYFTGSVKSETGYANTGGVAGYNNYGNITACYFTGDVKATGTSSCAGGIAGWNSGSSASITACYSTRSVEATGNAGGIAGFNVSGSITACYYTNADAGMGGGNGTDGSTKVDTTDATKNWTAAETAMNEAFDTNSVGWKYDGAAADTPPKLKKSDS